MLTAAHTGSAAGVPQQMRYTPAQQDKKARGGAGTRRLRAGDDVMGRQQRLRSMVAI